MIKNYQLYTAVGVSLLLTVAVFAAPMSITESIGKVTSLAQTASAQEEGDASFETTDDPGSWFRSDGGEIAGTQSLAIIEAGNSVHFSMEETNTVHTVTSLLWPTGAANMPFDQPAAVQAPQEVTLEDPGLYVFVCKLHPYMLAAVIADDPETDALDLGATVDMINGIEELPTSSDLATRLLRTFFIATNPDNWQDFTSEEPWHVEYPDANVLVGTGTDSETVEVNLKDTLEERYGQDIKLPGLKRPPKEGVGEVWIDTQYEKTAGKDKPGTVTAVDAESWKVTRKVALPDVNMNNPHNMWTDIDQTVIYQTEWFDKYLTTFDRETGELVGRIEVGEAPAHVMTRTDTDQIHVSINGGTSVAELPPGGEEEETRHIFVQQEGDLPAQPHAHWMGHDGQTMVTPNSNTHDSTLYSFGEEEIVNKQATGILPIATGMMPDSSKYYVANFLSNTVSVMDAETGEKLSDVDLLENYDPISGEITGPIGALPIQTPVSPNGEFVVTANTLSGTITIIDTEEDELVKMLACDAGCHGVNFGAKQGGGYYAYVSSKFANTMIVVDIDPNNDGDASDAKVVGRVALTAKGFTETDDTITDYAGMGGQGVLPIPLVYNGWVQKLPDEWKDELTEEQLEPIGN